MSLRSPRPDGADSGATVPEPPDVGCVMHHIVTGRPPGAVAGLADGMADPPRSNVLIAAPAGAKGGRRARWAQGREQ
jgi:hypothetical protein